MDITVISTIVDGVIALLGCGAFATLLFYSAKKREANADASAKEASALSQFAAEWEKLYIEKDKSEDELMKKIDDLQKQITSLRKEVMKYQDQIHEVSLKLKDAEWDRCVRAGCPQRVPPRDESAIAAMNVVEQ